MVDVYLSLGSNSERQKNIAAALHQLGEKFGQLTLSPIYESKAIDGVGENYHNLCLGLVSDLSLHQFRHQIKAIEQNLGRNREVKTVVTIDIDILIFGDQVVKPGEKELSTLPHPDLLSQAYVLTPLNDIASDLIHPLAQKSIAQLHQELGSDQSLIRLS